MSNEPRLWQYEGHWRIQSLRQIQDRHGAQDTWESWREHGHVLFFESEELARAYMSGETKKKGKENNETTAT